MNNSNPTTAGSTQQYSVNIITQRRLKKKAEIKASQEKIMTITQNIFSPPKNLSKMDSIMNNLNAGIAAYDGLMTGIKIFKKIRMTFSRK